MPEPGGGKGTAMKTKDPYAVPGIAQDATSRELSRVSRSLLRRHHPDTQTDPAPRNTRPPPAPCCNRPGTPTPFWPTLQRRSEHDRAAPKAHSPRQVRDHQNRHQGQDAMKILGVRCSLPSADA